ncbi:hypothetical protein VN97_g2203 [Penicillium thymicola]|uniref:Uncharacterized protein n=1 Tax=Penicillium thymicola TaxID=293382 RepID=A0AAI9TQ05_PENTH|nr:hypothetical protein VN97_g2203 [Penicillium thymicola]
MQQKHTSKKRKEIKILFQWVLSDKAKVGYSCYPPNPDRHKQKPVPSQLINKERKKEKKKKRKKKKKKKKKANTKS